MSTWPRRNEQAILKEVLRAFIKENNLKTAEDVQKELRDVFTGTLQEMLEAEMDQNLGYENTTTLTRTWRTGGTNTAKRRYTVSMVPSR